MSIFLLHVYHHDHRLSERIHTCFIKKYNPNYAHKNIHSHSFILKLALKFSTKKSLDNKIIYIRLHLGSFLFGELVVLF